MTRQMSYRQVVCAILCVWITFVASATYANDSSDLSADSAFTDRIASLFRSSHVQPEPNAEPEDDSDLEDPDLSALSELESLLSEPVLVPGSSAATLTELIDDLPTQLSPGYVMPRVPRRTPAAVTQIDYDMIWSSGARRMTELFDIYVPNTQITKHFFSFEHVITRGVLGDLEDKYLFLVNGKIMNHQTITGAFSEIRDLPLLGDIHHVDFVRGPGSAMWGPGAISGVVSLVTHNAMTFQGTDATYRQGGLETFSALEIRHGRKFTEDSGIFVYYGIADYDGANFSNAPMKYSTSFDTPDVLPNYSAGQPIAAPGIFGNDHESWRSRAKMKLHTQYTKGNFDFWVRYTQGGEKASPTRGNFALPPYGDQTAEQDYANASAFQFGYVQLTLFGQYVWEINDCLNAEFRLSWDSMDFSRAFQTSSGQKSTGNPHREEETYGRVMFNWTPNDSHSSAAGFAASHGRFGLRTWSFPDQPGNTIINGTNGPWWTTSYAFIGEHQWRINDCWTLFLTGRWDQHTYTKTLFSPRGAIVWTPDEVNTLKFIATESARRLPEDVLFGDFRNGRGRTDVETIESLELRYERRPSEAWSWAVGSFYQEQEFVGLSGFANSDQKSFAHVTSWGAELELAYRTERTRIIASQSYTGLLNFNLQGNFALPEDFDLGGDYFIQNISAAPYGFGNEFANQSPHLTKIAVHYQHDCCWSSDASLRIYWGRPGDQDLAAFRNARFAATGSADRETDPGFNKSFRGSYFLNYALNYRYNEHMTARLDFYNILGWFEEDLNKRNFIFQPGSYRDEAAAIAATVRFKY